MLFREAVAASLTPPVASFTFYTLTGEVRVKHAEARPNKFILIHTVYFRHHFLRTFHDKLTSGKLCCARSAHLLLLYFYFIFPESYYHN